jgi:predicted nuclease with TOPRIM domain
MIVPIVFLFILFTEMRNMQSAAREHTQRVFQETEKLRKQLAEKESSIERRSKELNEQVAQTDMERRKLEEERKKVWVHPHFCWCYCLF